MVEWLKLAAGSKDVALALSLLFNAAACTAIWRLYKSREALQEKVTGLLVSLVSELSRTTTRLLERDRI